MSSTNRGSTYHDNGAYYTERAVARVIIDAILPLAVERFGPRLICAELHAGAGAFIAELLSRPEVDSVYAMDIDPHAPALIDGARYEWRVGSCLPKPVVWHRSEAKGGPLVVQEAGGWPEEWPAPHLIVGNPPFGQPCPGRKSPLPVAQAHVEAALGILAPGGFLSYLLPGSYLGSSTRRKWFNKGNAPLIVEHLDPRPTFTGGGSDSMEYAGIHWDSSRSATDYTGRWVTYA